MALVLFDLDNTLLTGDSEEAWTWYLKEQGLVGQEFFKKKVKFDTDYRSGRFDTMAYSIFLMEPLIGRTTQEVEKLAKPFALEVEDKFSDSLTQRLIQKHNSDECLLVSATLSFLVREISSLLGLKTFFGTDAEIKDGVYTGALKGIPNFSEEKVRRVKEWALLEGVSVEDKVYAYSDSIYDLPMLEFADYPIAVDPDDKLKRISEERKWTIIDRAT